MLPVTSPGNGKEDISSAAIVNVEALAMNAPEIAAYLKFMLDSPQNNVENDSNHLDLIKLIMQSLCQFVKLLFCHVYKK